MGNQIKTNKRSVNKTSVASPRQGTSPMIASVEAILGETSQIRVTFDMNVMISSLPFEWSTTGLSPNVFAQSIVSTTPTELVLDFGSDVSGFTGINVPQSNSIGMTNSGKAIPPGNYLV